MDFKLKIIEVSEKIKSKNCYMGRMGLGLLNNAPPKPIN
jgi:hypothetical protein